MTLNRNDANKYLDKVPDIEALFKKNKIKFKCYL